MTATSRSDSAPVSRLPARVRGGMSMAIGSLPHLSLADAATLAVSSTDVVTIPTLPKRSPLEGMIAQALVGIHGVTVGQYGSIAIDVAAIDASAPVHTDLDHEAFAGLRSFLRCAADFPGPVKWQFVGPITLGMALVRAGVPASIAFDVAARAVDAHIGRVLTGVDEAFSGVEQIVLLDEPAFGFVSDEDFELTPDVAIDLVSGVLATIEGAATAGVHCCGDADWPTLMAAGPTVLSIPARLSLVDDAGAIQQFLDQGGWIAWGAVPTEGPVPTTAERPWKHLRGLWRQLVQRGCSPSMLYGQSLITPECGLGLHSAAVAERVLRITADLSRRVREQAAASRFTFGG